MAIRVGIAMDLEVRQWELTQEFRNTRGWRSTSAFTNKKEALAWQEKKMQELSCKAVDPGQQLKRPGVSKWFGFVFEHDGPKK